MSGPTTRRRLRWSAVAAVCMVMGASVPSAAEFPAGGGYQRISGEGSSWAANAIDAMRVNVRQFGITVDYNPSGSTSGRKNFLNGTVDFAASDIPFQFQPEDGSAPENPAPGSYAYMPVTAGGTAFMYNLLIAGKRVTNLRLSGENVAKIFTGAITSWDDPAIKADNPGLVMPARKIVPVVRSDGSGSTAQFTAWMIDRHPAIWNAYCARSGRAPKCGFTSFYPTIPGMIAQSGDIGVAGYVSQGFAEGAIGYVNYSYALGAQFPVAKVLNAAGFYVEPTPEAVAVSLLKARINTDESNPATYLTQDLRGVYTDNDPRSYQLSSYSYLILPTKVAGQFNEAKGRTLGAFAYYAMCQAQQQSASLGYSPMPVNLVEASFDQIRKIPGVVVQDINIGSCNNPTFSADGTNVLAASAPAPKACDQRGSASQCPDGTGGLAGVPTAVATTPQPTQTTAPAGGGGGGGGGGGNTATTVPGSGGTSTGATGGTVTTLAGGAGGGIDGGGIDGGVDGGTPITDGSGGLVDGGGQPIVDGGEGACDPATGECATDGGLAGGGNGSVTDIAVGPGVGSVVPTVIEARPAPGSSTVLILLVVGLLLGVVVGPPLVWRRMSASTKARMP